MPFVPESTFEITPEARHFLESLGNRTDFPSFSANVQSIAGVSRDMAAQVGRLHDAIVQDVSLTAKVLQISNTVAMNAGGGTITSVSQAILLLGFDRVRHLALAASVFEQLNRKTPVVRELMALALVNANQSWQLALHVGYAKAEIAYLSGMFHNIGEVLVSCYRPRDHARWLASLSRGPRVAGAERRLIGVSFEEIGVAVAQEWRLPAEIVGAMRAKPLIGTESARTLGNIARLSVELTNAIYRHDVSGQPGVLASLLRQYALPLGLDDDTVLESAQVALVDSRSTLAAVNAPVDGFKLTQQIRAAAAAFGELDGRHRVAYSAANDDAHTGTNASAAGGEDDLFGDAMHGESVGTLSGPTHAGTRESRTRDALRAMNGLNAESTSGEPYDVGRASRAALEAICGAGYRRALLALSSEDFSRVRGRLGAGEGHEKALREFLVRLTTGASSLATSLNAREDVFATSANWPGLKRDPLLRSLAPHSFGLLPLVHDDRLIGCLYFDDPAEVEAPDTMRELLCSVRDQLVQAFAEQRRQAA